MITPAFVLGGRATFTLETDRDYYTLRVSKTYFDDSKRPRYFVFQMVDPNRKRNARGRYIGELDADTGTIRPTTKSWLDLDSPEMLEIQQAFDAIWGDSPLPHTWELHHTGRCGVCDRRLTTPESLERGIGPECYGRRNARAIRRTSHRQLPMTTGAGR